MKHELDIHQEDPWKLFQRWYNNASGNAVIGFSDRILYPFRLLMKKAYPPFLLHGGDAMVLSTASKDGQPSARVVLYKGIREEGVVFYTNYNSRKAKELAVNQRAASVFHWALPERQVRFEGVIEKVSNEMSDHYWASRPRGSQIGGWASEQSEAIADRAELLLKVKAIEEKFRGQSVPRPPHWGGFVLKASSIEFWEACLARLHRRRKYEKRNGVWESSLLAP
jgi:pyridoxamine 5'-phosphate oxidase